MEPFVRLESLAAPLLENDVDTDAIFPARYLLRMEKSGLGRFLFIDRRAAAGHRGHVLDDPTFAGAQILLAGSNFGCGSSREQAVWALAGAGFRCVIAASFGEIFYGNCFKNGVLPIILPVHQVEQLGALAAAHASFAVDLVTQAITVEGRTWRFDIAPQRRDNLLKGYDEADEILANSEPEIAAFEARLRAAQPWLFDVPRLDAVTIGARS